MIGIRQQAAKRSAVTIYAQDSFTRANHTSSLGTADVGGAWNVYGGTLGISSNQAYPPGDIDHSMYGLGVSATDVIVSALVPTLINHTGVFARGNAFGSGGVVNNFYLASTDGAGTLTLYKRVAGSYTLLGTSAGGVMASGQTLGLSCKGTAIKALVNGAAVISVTDSSIALSTACGIRGGAHGTPATGANKRWDDFLVVAS